MKSVTCSLLLIALVTSAIGQTGKHSSDFIWRRATPESVGVSSEKLGHIAGNLERQRTHKLVIIKNDRIIFEWYAPGHEGLDRKHYCASMSKSLVSGLSLLLALNEQYIFPDAPACLYIPEWKKDERKSKITIRQLATHTSGLDDSEGSSEEQLALKQKGLDRHMDLKGWKGQFWIRNPDPFSVSRDSTPVLSQPGTKYMYSNPGIAMLGYAVTRSLEGSPYGNIEELLRKTYESIGIQQKDWNIGYGKIYEVDSLKLVAGWGGGNFSVNAISRIARLMMRKGNWEGKQLIDSAWVERVTKYEGTPLPDPEVDAAMIPPTTLGWYSNALGTWKYLPRDAFAAAGAGNQMLLVVPSLQLIIIRNGEAIANPSVGEGFWSSAFRHLFNPVIAAIDGSPYSKSKFITDAQFAEKSEIIRRAAGSDNWPMTWGNDDLIYAGYGDGWGFEPKADIKLSLGVAKIAGDPPNFKGENIRTTSGERVGEGVMGPKASGMLMLEDTLYMLVRNVSNSQLAWSADHGVTWTWSDWKFSDGFGYPVFLNYGKNYADARDGYVYVYSHDEASAYKMTDAMVLMRVKKSSLKRKEAYEYYAGADGSGAATWSANPGDKEPVFKNPGRCFRSGVSYNKALGRYLWTQIMEHPGEEAKDSRFQGGLAIFESHNPWGPWSTIYYNTNWDVGPGEAGSIPTKWISKDGTECYFVFSGEDAFSLRKLTFTIDRKYK